MRSKGLKVAHAYDHYVYGIQKTESNPNGCQYIRIEAAVEQKMAELGDVRIEKVTYQYGMSTENENHNVLIFYLERRPNWFRRFWDWVNKDKLPQEGDELA